MHAEFGEDRLRGFGVAMGRILGFSADLRLRHVMHLLQFSNARYYGSFVL